MKTTDVAALTGKLKTAAQAWANAKIDVMLPGDKATARSFAKNAVNNVLVRSEVKLNEWIDGILLFVANAAGEVDTDVMVDHLAAIFSELEPMAYDFGGFRLTAGKGRAEIHFPRFVGLIAGIEGVALNADDISELKQFINN